MKWLHRDTVERVVMWMLNLGLKHPALKFHSGSCLPHNVVDYMFFPEPSGVKLSDASKKLGKKFATGASVVKVPCCFS